MRTVLLTLLLCAGSVILSAQDTAVSEMKLRADTGDVQAQLQLATAYRKGDGLPRDLKQAAQWLGRAAQQGDRSALRELGLVHAELAAGKDTQDLSRAWAWLALAAGKGDEKARLELEKLEPTLSKERIIAGHLRAGDGLLYGAGVPADPAAAVKYYEWLINKRISAGSARLGEMYAEGRGVPQNHQRARELCENDAKSGYASAMHCMALVSLKTNEERAAFEWFRKAAVRGHAPAMKRVADLYAQGTGVKQDKVTALAWYTMAERSGLKEAATARQQLAAMMTQKQIAKARAMYREWQYPQIREIGTYHRW